MKNALKRITQKYETPDLVLFAILACYLILTIATLTDYGEAWDNITMYQYAKQTAAIYSHPFQKYLKYEYGPTDLRFFGPFIITTAFFLSKIFVPIIPAWSTPDFFRFIYFLTYLAGVAGFYYLGKRYLSPWVSLAMVLVFISQPLFFGQAPISPKDTTFMGLVILSIYFGLKMTDHIPDEADRPALLSKKQGISLAVLGAVLVLVIGLNQLLIKTILTWITNASEGSFFKQMFLKYAAGYTPERFEDYVTLLSALVLRGAALVAVIAAVWIMTPKSLIKAVRRTGRAFKRKFVVLAGILLGLSVSVRILGLISGGILLVIVIFKKPFKNWFYAIVAYTITSFVTIYLTWPFLWPNPITRFIESLKINLGHQHTPPIFFNGQSYSSSNLPVAYVPTLISIQLTIPLLILAAAGLVILFTRKKQGKDLWIVVGMWFFLPVLLLVGLRPELHDNIRHIIFILPPLFLLAGSSLEKIFGWVKGKTLLYFGIVLIIMAPGIIHNIRYHPYEYIYYNQLVGGTAAGTQRFEADFLALSLSEAVNAVNEMVPENATVLVIGPYNIARNTIRPDINLINKNDNPDESLDQSNTFLVTYGMPSADRNLSTIYQVMAGDVPLGGVYALTDPD